MPRTVCEGKGNQDREQLRESVGIRAARFVGRENKG